MFQIIVLINAAVKSEALSTIDVKLSLLKAPNLVSQMQYMSRGKFSIKI
jgi:hypothetical protein